MELKRDVNATTDKGTIQVSDPDVACRYRNKAHFDYFLSQIRWLIIRYTFSAPGTKVIINLRYRLVGKIFGNLMMKILRTTTKTSPVEETLRRPLEIDRAGKSCQFRLKYRRKMDPYEYSLERAHKSDEIAQTCRHPMHKQQRPNERTKAKQDRKARIRCGEPKHGQVINHQTSKVGLRCLPCRLSKTNNYW